jgi:hypothetical protein
MSWRVVYKKSQRPVSIIFILKMSNVGWRIHSGLEDMMKDVEIIWSE